MAFYDEPQWAVVGDTFPTGCMPQVNSGEGIGEGPVESELPAGARNRLGLVKVSLPQRV